jgi:arsenate reductase
MSDYTIYHNPRCSKSRQTLQLLLDNGIEPEIVLYLDTPPKAASLKQLLAKLGISARDLLRKGEQAYKDLVERPIVICGDQAVLGRPPENALQLIS